jgi:hypothetical protein
MQSIVRRPIGLRGAQIRSVQTWQRHREIEAVVPLHLADRLAHSVLRQAQFDGKAADNLAERLGPDGRGGERYRHGSDPGIAPNGRSAGDRVKAIAVYPGQQNSAHLADLPMPSLEEIPNGRGVLVRLLRCGVDGTDKEINAAEYGAAPEGYD